jgi:Ca2+-binding RTX toxin-like protein
MDGGDGDDRLQGSATSDFFTGGAGVDRFVFGPAWGSDTISDFEDGVELIDLSASGLTFGDLTIFDEFGFGDTTIESSAGRIVLTGVAVESVTQADFVF